MKNVEIKRANKSTGVWDRDIYKKAECAEPTKQAEKASGKSLEEMVDDLLRAVGFDIDSGDEVPFELTQEVDKQIREDLNQIITSELKLANISEIQPELRSNVGQI